MFPEVESSSGFQEMENYQLLGSGRRVTQILAWRWRLLLTALLLRHNGDFYQSSCVWETTFLGAAQSLKNKLRALDPEKLYLFPLYVPLTSNALSCAEMQLCIHLEPCRIKMRHRAANVALPPAQSSSETHHKYQYPVSILHAVHQK